MTSTEQNSLIDSAQEVREGEDLDPIKIDEFIKQNCPTIQGQPDVKQFPSGASNLTYQVTYPDQTFILRRPPFGKKAKGAHDMHREYKVMDGLKEQFPYVPNMIAFSEAGQVLDVDFYLMEKVEGIILRKEWPSQLKMSENEVKQLNLSFIDKLIQLHTIDPKETTLADIGKGSGYVKRQIEGWSDRYLKSMTDDAADCTSVMQWLSENQPEDIANCIIHNDYRLDNVVLSDQDPQKIIGVLDWEMATLGDPLMDLGNSLAYWVQADDEPQFQIMRQQCSHTQGMLTRDEIIEYYLENAPFQCNDFTFYEVYGLFRLIVILQQIYYRYYHGQTKDKRFAQFIYAAQYLALRCQRIIEKKG